MIRTLIVDDEPLNLNELKYLLSRHEDIDVVAESNSMNNALQLLEKHKLDLVFLDIQMEKEISGLEVAKFITKLDKPPLIIFVTAHSQYALKAFDFQPVHYLLKPVSEIKLDQALQRIRAIVDNESNQLPAEIYEKMMGAVQSILPSITLTIKYKSEDDYNDTIYPTVYLKPEEILYLHKEKSGNTINIYTVDGQRYGGVRQTLQEFENQLAPRHFFRNHTSYLVNLKYVRGLKPRASGEENYLLLLKNTTLELPLSRLKITELNSALE